MKKAIFVLFLLSIRATSFNKSDNYIIPDSAIRFRVVANSNSIDDQLQKAIVKEKLSNELKTIIKNSDSIQGAREIINNNISKIEKIVSQEAKDYNINYGLNYFPKKEYKNVIYPAGNYESLVITIGKGLGNNWWCVLYPPLCFIEEENKSNDYALYVKELFNKFNF